MAVAVLELDLREISVVPGHNARAAVGDVSELMASMEVFGLLQPIIVAENGGNYLLVAGERRLAAARGLGWSSITAIVREFGELERAIAMVIENLQRVDLSPLEEAAAFQSLIALGLKQGVIAAKVGRSQAHISKRLSLLALPAKIRKKVDSGGITLEAALEPKRKKRAPKVSATPEAIEALAEPVSAMNQSVELGNRKVWILADPEILGELRNGWSRPVQVHAEENPDGSWEMTFRTYEERMAVAAFETFTPEQGAESTQTAEQPLPSSDGGSAAPAHLHAAAPVSQHVCRSCGRREGPWAEMVEIGWLCVECDSKAPVAAALQKQGRAIDQRTGVAI